MSNLPSELRDAAEKLLAAHRAAGTRVAVAESCTGGLVSAALTAIAGSSDVFLAGFVTYSNEAKARMLGVDGALIETRGAVSEEVALEMAEGALVRSGADVAVSITGVAGPSGGSREKPVGTVWFARAANNDSQHVEIKGFSSDWSREKIQLQAALAALELLSP